MSALPPVVRIRNLDLRYRQRSWDFAVRERERIDAHFRRLREATPGLWNGPVLLAHELRLQADRLSAAYLQTDFASFIAWRDWNCPDPAIANCFALGAIQAADGAFLLGIMHADTANAGRIYFPGGTPDPSDIAGETVDLEGSVRREVEEETGLEPGAFAIDPHWYAVPSGPRIGLLKRMRSTLPADLLCDRIAANLARQAHPELAGIHVARGPADLSERMPDFIRAFLLYEWRERGDR